MSVVGMLSFGGCYSVQFGNVPIVPTSAMTQEGVHKVLPAVIKCYERWNHRINTGLLNRWLEAIQRVHAPPPGPRNRTIKLKYLTQVGDLTRRQWYPF